MRASAVTLFAVLLGCTPAIAAPYYSLGVSPNGMNTWSTPCRIDTTTHAITTGSDNTANFSAYATVGAVGASVTSSASLLVFSGGTNDNVTPIAYCDDFVIDGYGSYVTGTMYFRFRAHVGGTGGEAGCRSDVLPWITVGSNDYTGGFRTTNQAGYPTYQAWGLLQGATPSGDIDTVIAITRGWPVNTPFSVRLYLTTSVLTSVTAAHPVASWWGNGGGLGASAPSGGLSLGNASGLVMSLPQYFALRSSSWHIANSQRDSYWTGVGGAPGSGASFALAGATPNPARRSGVSLAFALPDGAPAALELFDVTGRRVAGRDVGALGAGAHTVRLEGGRALAPGLYLARLSRAGEVRTARVSVVE